MASDIDTDALGGFSEPAPYNGDTIKAAENRPGVHVVWNDQGELIFVGQSAKTRTRLRQHLSGDREASVLHKQVGEALDRSLGRVATKDEIRAWLENCTVAWKYDPRSALCRPGS